MSKNSKGDIYKAYLFKGYAGERGKFRLAEASRDFSLPKSKTGLVTLLTTEQFEELVTAFEGINVFNSSMLKKTLSELAKVFRIIVGSDNEVICFIKAGYAAVCKSPVPGVMDTKDLLFRIMTYAINNTVVIARNKNCESDIYNEQDYSGVILLVQRSDGVITPGSKSVHFNKDGKTVILNDKPTE